MRKLIFIMLIAVQAQSQSFFDDYKFYIEKTQTAGLFNTIDRMVMEDDSDLSDVEKFHRHSKMVFSKKNIDKMTQVVKTGEFGGFCAYAIREGYYYRSNPKHYVVEAGDTLFFYDRWTKLKWTYESTSRNTAEASWKKLSQLK